MKSRLAVSITNATRSALEDARERSGRTLTDEVEIRLRESLGVKASEGLVLLKLDDGLWAWLTAYVDGIGFAGDHEQSAIYMIRSQMITYYENANFRALMLPHLPPSIQRACGYDGPPKLPGAEP